MQLALPNSHIRGKADAACHLVLRRHVHAPPPAVLSRFYVPALPALSHTVMEQTATATATATTNTAPPPPLPPSAAWRWAHWMCWRGWLARLYALDDTLARGHAGAAGCSRCRHVGACAAHLGYAGGGHAALHR